MQMPTANWLASQLALEKITVGKLGTAGVVYLSNRYAHAKVDLLPGGARQLTSDWVVVATGPEYRLSQSKNPLVRQLLDTRLATACRIDNFEVGGFATTNLELDGLPGVYAMGAMVRGEDYAVHSFPALKRHAEVIAEHLITEA
jgi:hypothetical protein